jgi:hypothetical protein
MGLTLPQELREWAKILFDSELVYKESPQTETVHTYDDGWTCRRCVNSSAVNSVGQFMHNCWAGSNGGNIFYALYDQHELPRVAFYYEGTRYLGSVLRAHNNLAKPIDFMRLVEAFPHHPSLAIHERAMMLNRGYIDHVVDPLWQPESQSLLVE